MTISLTYGYGKGTEGDPWEKLLTVSESAVKEANRVLSRAYQRAAPALNAAQAVRLSGPHVEPAYEALLGEIEQELEGLCARHDYRQMLFVSRLCVGLPVFREREPHLHATRMRGQAADRWVLKRGDRGLATDYMRIEEDGYSIGEPPDSLYRDAVKLHRLAEFHQRTVLEFMRFNFLRLCSSENGLPGPAMVVVAVEDEAAVGLDCASGEARFAAELFELRHGYNNAFSGWGLGEFGSEGKPLAMVYNYQEVDERPYGGGMLFKPDALWFDTLLRYGERFPALFVRDLGVPVHHLWAVSRGLYKLAIDASKADGARLTPWGLITGTLPIRRDDVLGGPLEEAARRELAESYPGRQTDADLGQSVKRFVRLASSSPGESAGAGRENPSSEAAPQRDREWTTESVRVPAYPYMIHGHEGHELWIVDYLRTIPFLQGLVGELTFSGSNETTGSGQSDAYERTSAFDARLAEVLGEVPGVGVAFADKREDTGLPNAKFYFNGGAEHREIDVPVCVGEVLIAVQTWAREVDLKIFVGDYGAMKRRWKLVKKKLRSTDKLYTDYLLGHQEGRQRMEEENLRYVLPVLCGPYAEPIVSLRPEDWLRPPSAVTSAEVDRSEVGKATARVLTPPELVDFLDTVTEGELIRICERNGWDL